MVRHILKLLSLYVFFVVHASHEGKEDDGSSSPLPLAIMRACRVYCGGRLLAAVQMSQLYSDCKEFVDMPMKEDPEVVVAAFDAEFDGGLGNLTLLGDFVSKYFDAAGSDVEKYVPGDWTASPPSLLQIKDEEYRTWALSLNDLWKTLGRKTSSSVDQFPQRHSFIPRDHPMIVPGGRFRESYYWDSLWIIQGLSICEMSKTAADVVNNLLDDVKLFGFVPNGGRVYYTDRSQPPVLSEMVKLIVKEDGNESSLARRAFPLLEHEYEFWMSSKHAVQLEVNGTAYVANRYHSGAYSPRPESYREDEDLLRASALEERKVKGGEGNKLFNNIRSGAESGWDFTSRFIFGSDRKDESPPLPRATADNYRVLETQGKKQFPLTSEQTAEVLSICLNSFMMRFERNMATLCSTYFSSEKDCSLWERRVEARKKLLNDLFWKESLGRWTDLNMDSLEPILTCAELDNDNVGGCVSWHAHAAEWLPLWSLEPSEMDSLQTAVDSFLSSGLMDGKVGPLTTTIVSGQQWDAPNVWAPLVDLLVDGLREQGFTELASSMASEWLEAAHLAFKDSGFMFEKYNAFDPNEMGGGGEYVPQTGFGWTNGVALKFLSTYEVT